MKNFFKALFVISVLSFSLVAGAQGTTITTGGDTNPGGGTTITTGGNSTVGGGTQLVSTKIQNPIRYNNFYEFVSAVIEVIVEILMPFVVLMFVWTGFMFVKAQGNKTEIDTAKTALVWTVLGTFVLLGAWAFAQIIGNTVTQIAPPGASLPLN